MLITLSGIAVLVHFLSEFALPWLDFRNAIRAGDHATMDSMYAVALPWFRATKKTNYSRICLDYCYVILSLNNDLLTIWQKMRTCSLLGNSGRNIAWDQANEFMNKYVKEMGPSSPERIDEIISMLNGMRSAEEPTRRAMGMEREDPTEYTPVKIEHVNSIVKALESRLGQTRQSLAGSHGNCFGTGEPWRTVNPCGGNLSPNLPGAATRGVAARAWIQTKLGAVPFPVDT
jgi:hypothetical protein